MVLLLGFSASLASSVEFTGEYTGDIFSNTSGGLQQGTRYLDNLDLVLTADFGGLVFCRL
jgi:carbohydrate-selective porin OprB